MTSMSEAPAQVKPPVRGPPKGGGIDYSRFDSIEDSDDEKPKSSTSASAKPAEKPHCFNCHKDIVKPLRCSICKKVEYCSAPCQREDWPYHKRTCKKPEAPKEEKAPVAARKSEEKPIKQKEEEKVVDNDENLTWYRHREWKPQEPKQEFKPTQISHEDAQAEKEVDEKPAAGSVWNKAGTWEERDATAFAHKTLKERLCKLSLNVDVGGGSLSVDGVDAIEGDASKPVIRGKMRHVFDLSFKQKFVFKWMESDGQKSAKGHVEVSDFTNDTFTQGVMSEPALRVSFKDSRLLEAARRRAVESALGTSPWPPGSGTLMHGVAQGMELFAKEYQETT